MKRTIFELLCMTFCLVLSMNVYAETTAVVGGLKYSFQGNNATVIGYENLNLSGGFLNIPETVEWNGLTFDVSEIGDGAFNCCDQIIKLKINYQNVGEYAFDMCENLEYVDITGGCVGKSAFHGCTKLKNVKINSYSYIGSHAFSYCWSLESVTLNWIYDIYDDAFSNCTNLKWIDFGNNLRRIGSNAFGNCTSLTYLVFPETLSQVCLNNSPKSSGDYYYPYDWWGDSCSSNYSYGGFPVNYPLLSTQSAFTGCDLIQSVIYLGNWCSDGLSNVNYYFAKNSDFVTWSSTQFTYTGSVPSPNITCNLPAGFQLANDFTMPVLDKNVGTYETTIPMTFSNGHQSFTADIPYKYTIAPLSLKARVKNATREYGEVNPEFQTEYSGFIIGEDELVLTSKGTYSTTAYANSDVGKYTVTQSGATAQNYTIEYEPGTLTVTKAPLTVTARSKTMTYGDRMPTLEVDYAGLKNNESKPAWITDPDIMTTGTSSSNVGTYPITIRGGEAKNYNVTYKQGTLTINKASLTATTQDAIREYGDEDPEFEMTYSGLKNNESAPVWRVTPTIVTATSKSSPVGTYDITATGGDARNYQVQYVNTGKLTVTKAPLTAKARSYTKKQGEPNPVFAVDYEGFKNGETKLALTQEPIAVTSAQQNSRPGTYPITLSDGIAMNYDFTYVDGTLTILPSDNPQEETENILTLSGLTANRGAQVTLPIGMTNKKSITGVQFDLYLPTGVTVATNTKGKLMVTTTSRMDGNYSITGSDMGDYVRIVGYSADSDPFTGTSGDILNVTLNIGNDVADGNYTVRLKDIVLSDVNNTEHHPADVGGVLTVKSYTLGDVDNSGAVNINDVVCIINHILNRTTGTFIEEAADVDGSGVININDVVSLINRFILHRNNAPKKVSAENVVTEAGKDWLYLDDFVITAGETKEIAVMMKNANEVKAVQGNIKLPEGISFVTKSNGRLDVANLNDRSEDFTLSCALQEDGSMTFAQYSADGFAYDGNEGGIFTFKVRLDEDLPFGDYAVKLSNVVMSIDGVAYEAPDRTSDMIISIITSITDSSIADPDGAMIFDATGKRLSKLQRGVNIIHMSDGTVKKVLVK